MDSSNPVVRVHSMSFGPGQVEEFQISSLSLKNVIRRLPLSLTFDPVALFLLRAITEDPGFRAGLVVAWEQIRKYIDVSAWANLSDSERSSAPEGLGLTSSSVFRATFLIHGPVAVADVALPDQTPALYREGGKRAYLQSWNKFTSEFKLEIRQSFIKRLIFKKAAVEWNTPSALNRPASPKASGNVMVCRLEDFNVLVSSQFELFANTSKPVQLLTGYTKLGEKGTSRSMVRASFLELVFEVTVSENGIDLKTLSVDDFDSIDVVIEGLRSKQDDRINQVLKLLKPHIASLASLLVKSFLETEIQKGTENIGRLEESLLLKGVEVPGLFRRRPDMSIQVTQTA